MKPLQVAQSKGARLAGKRVLVTEANAFMGPASVALFRAEGAEVIADDSEIGRAHV